MKNKIIIVGLGPDDIDLMTIKAMDILKSGKYIVLRTMRCAAAIYLEENKIQYESMDSIYDEVDDFFELEKEIVKHIVSLAQQKEIIYAVPGSGIYDDGTVEAICSSYSNVQIVPGVANNAYMIAKDIPKDITSGACIIPASMLTEANICTRVPMCITSLDNEYLLSDIKLLLSQYYLDEHVVKLINNTEQKEIKIYEIDRGHKVDHTSILIVPPKVQGERYDLYDLMQIFKKLRSPQGCPWDREQTHLSLKRCLIEECAEVLDTIDDNDMDALMDELGDVLLQILFHSTIAKERGDFDIYDVISNLATKLTIRHPHVFADTKVADSKEVLSNWDEIKKKQRNNKTESEIMRKIPSNLNALIRAQKIQERAAKVGFDWEDVSGALDKVKEELEEVLAEYRAQDTDKLREEIGDLLFAVVNVCRFFDILSEFALNEATTKFIMRFEVMESQIITQNKAFSQLSAKEMDIFWENAKTIAEK